ncbi:hypothetical protein B566_EDAN006229 [Ephemera danica]|nr:hypothetical protein B566_EDAN006229 [Ephemera danica]
MQSKFLEEMDEKMSEVVSELLKEVETSELVNDSQRYLFEDSQKYENRIKSEKAGVLPDKQFLARNSLLTDLFEIKHIRTIYHIFIAILIILFLNTVIYDLVDTGRLNLSFELIIWSFGDMRTVIMIWLCMMASTFGVYLCFHLYATHRARLQPSGFPRYVKQD